ncbi:hypothetical protein [Parafrankia sp. EUN1f]|uniref:hypothetical protein n=1 Tax=Parafrankia sp. EUN1f TaxID=102897 RepID=UPI0001C46FD7|nr:hypothetical protein [Parafrankia sp. EUN1f]EFC86292.1 hypothetical protein FrEUN1fDRAFT_0562 [Parafrankia sp. EUN1f]
MSAPLGQKVLAGILTFLFFALVIFGLGAAFDQFGHRAWGHAIGIGACVIMVVAGVATSRRDQ